MSEPRFRRAPRVVWRRGADCVLVRRVGDEALELDAMAAVVWVSLGNDCSLDQLRGTVQNEIGRSSAEGKEALDGELDAALHSAIEALVERRVIEVVEW